MPCWHLALYDDFAWFYNRYWNEEFHSLAFPILERIWLPRLPRKGRDSGRLLRHGLPRRTADRRADTASPASTPPPEMIAHARENVPAAAFQVADASKFRVLGKFDGAVCTFDSLNHILERGGLASARFKRTAAALKPGAPFAFDMLLESAYQTNWTDASPWCATTTCWCSPARVSISGRVLAQCRITMFRLLDGCGGAATWKCTSAATRTSEIDAALEARGLRSRPNATMRATWA